MTRVLATLISLIATSQAVYFHLAETERKCFIEEIPDETMVIGNYKVQLHDPNGYADYPSIGMHVEVKDPEEKVILSKLYLSEGRFTFTSHTPGEHTICLYSNSTAVRVHIDIQAGKDRARRGSENRRLYRKPQSCPPASSCPTAACPPPTSSFPTGVQWVDTGLAGLGTAVTAALLFTGVYFICCGVVFCFKKLMQWCRPDSAIDLSLLADQTYLELETTQNWQESIRVAGVACTKMAEIASKPSRGGADVSSV